MAYCQHVVCNAEGEFVGRIANLPCGQAFTLPEPYFAVVVLKTGSEDDNDQGYEDFYSLPPFTIKDGLRLINY